MWRVINGAVISMALICMVVPARAGQKSAAQAILQRRADLEEKARQDRQKQALERKLKQAKIVAERKAGYANLDRLIAEPHVRELFETLGVSGGTIPLLPLEMGSALVLTGRGFEIHSTGVRDWVRRSDIRRSFFGPLFRERAIINTRNINFEELKSKLSREHTRLNKVKETGQLPADWAEDSARSFINIHAPWPGPSRADDAAATGIWF
jgi:hypothetical protein